MNSVGSAGRLMGAVERWVDGGMTGDRVADHELLLDRDHTTGDIYGMIEKWQRDELGNKTIDVRLNRSLTDMVQTLRNELADFAGSDSAAVTAFHIGRVGAKSAPEGFAAVGSVGGGDGGYSLITTCDAQGRNISDVNRV